ncbi:MAG: NAD(+) synthase [Planctomycetaceae bacterium]|nr:NAD(+) synthase [Planctomycetaceae bacterium]
MNQYGFARVTVASPLCVVGHPRKNVEAILAVLEQLGDSTPDVVVFPELCVSAYTCRDLFRQQQLLDECEQAIAALAAAEGNTDRLMFVGAPVPVGAQLFNCAVALWNGRIVGIVPKQNIPNYNEFEEARWFRAADGHEPAEIAYAGQANVPFGIDLLFSNSRGLVVFAEVCEDLWMPIPPSSQAAIMGANLLVNLSASNETVAKCEYRTDLVRNQSGRCVAAYAYSSAGPTESTTDVVFGGHCLITENSHLLAESRRVGDGSGLIRSSNWVTADIDVQKLDAERRLLSSFGEARRTLSQTYRIQVLTSKAKKVRNHAGLLRTVSGTPFVPRNKATLQNRCAEITGIQVAGLAKRLEAIPSQQACIGVSGGLDSTLALLVAVEAYRDLGLPVTNITGITMPGFGTTSRTRNNASKLMELLGVETRTIDIRQMCLDTFKALRHDPFGMGLFRSDRDLEQYGVAEFEAALQKLSPEQLSRGDLVFENVQARTRTLILMSHGFVLGTGDLSELALGWCTYNGDHMSMYNVNCSIPKTLVRFLVDYYADHRLNREQKAAEGSGIPDATGQIQHILKDIVATTISPELLPHAADRITQSTEDHIGPYELHDFYLLNFVRHGFGPEKSLFLSDHAEFTRPYSREVREQTLRTFLKRFFGQQFKRSCVPDGPKVGSVSLSPRGDWRMPSDADAGAWLEGVE